MKTLCLHGRLQTGEIFKSRLQTCKMLQLLQQYCGGTNNLYFPDAPFIVGSNDSNEEKRSWNNPINENQYDLQALDEYFNIHGPFDILVGFSQGASLALYLACRPHLWIKHVRLVIIAAPSNISHMIQEWPKEQLHPQCHIVCFCGVKDEAVPVQVTMSYLQSLHSYIINQQEQIHIIQHPGNHIFPNPFTITATTSSSPIALLQDLLLEVSYTPTNENIASSQQEEYNALVAIYGEETIIPVVIPFKSNREPMNKCPHFSITLAHSECILEFRFTRNYPVDVLEASLRSSSLSITNIHTKNRNMLCKSIEDVIETTVQRLKGQPCVFDVIQAVLDILSIQHEQEQDNNNNVLKEQEEEVEHDDTVSLSLSDEELAKNALEEITHKKYDWNLDKTTTDAGHWNIVIGLVGKPSSGKSSCFNVLCQVAKLESESDRIRKTAAVGAAPFTTILPNFGEAQVTLKQQQQHPVKITITIKDVAGLVPGAYCGRGKGNAFLNDLLDAAALIHIVDGSGSAGEDGVCRQDGVFDLLAPAKDVFWVLREIHLWIAGNVMCKWPREKTQGLKQQTAAEHVNNNMSKGKSIQERIVKLFTGYHATPSVIYKAAKLADLDLDRGARFTLFEIHRLVAHFILIRFPIVIGLNKCDLLPNRKQIEQVVTSIVEEAGYKSSPVIPMSCLAENILLSSSVEKSSKELIHQAQEICSKLLGGTTGIEQVLTLAVEARAPLLITVVNSIQTPPLHFLFKRGSKVVDVFEMLSRREVIGGDFVRAESWADEISWIQGKIPGRVISKEAFLRDSNCVLRIISNRKGKWQNS
jgi:ribosome-binding ATPase YchF (GTP1/OBG family)/dienelactone hydrolase